jgi:hypothetical protein
MASQDWFPVSIPSSLGPSPQGGALLTAVLALPELPRQPEVARNPLFAGAFLMTYNNENQSGEIN